MNTFASWHAARAIPYADPERAQTVLLIEALLFITHLGIFSLPPPPPKTKTLMWIYSSLTHLSCQPLISFLLPQMARKQDSAKKQDLPQ